VCSSTALCLSREGRARLLVILIKLNGLRQPCSCWTECVCLKGNNLHGFLLQQACSHAWGWGVFLSVFACAFCTYSAVRGLREYAGEISNFTATRYSCWRPIYSAFEITVKNVGVCSLRVSGEQVGTLCILQAVINTRGINTGVYKGGTGRSLWRYTSDQLARLTWKQRGCVCVALKSWGVNVECAAAAETVLLRPTDVLNQPPDFSVTAPLLWRRKRVKAIGQTLVLCMRMSAASNIVVLKHNYVMTWKNRWFELVLWNKLFVRTDS